MESRKDSLTSIKQCRFCLSQDGLSSLFGKPTTKKSIPLTLKILSNVSIEVMPSDKMPTYICNRCKFFMETCYDYKHICREADESILRYVQGGTALEPIVWPQSLVKLFRFGAKPSAKGVVKTVVEGGTTVEVTSQDGSDSEDGDEDVYNVKIEDGSTEGASACIKVVTSDPKDKKSKKDPEEKEEEAVKKSASSGCWACDECDCTYPLQQLLELHKMQKHRTRPLECEQCNAKFMSKYNLSMHQLQHSNEIPFECVACGTRFKRVSLLRRHERLAHAELLKYKCSSCPASFLSEEEFVQHKERHHRYADRSFACDMCDKKFQERGSLQRHKDSVHSTVPELFCEYCPERFTSVSKLARHVRSHAGDRPYPCKFCDKTFTKSHHYTRHVRVKHNDSRSAAALGGVARGEEGAGGVTEDYQCEQCSAMFASQDELIYHSAIHATQNLTCPLCQEKFADVDAVTAHIKSHVTGMEFMCDLCELVFTSKEKLDLHLITAHEDELRQQELTNDESSEEMDADEECDLINPINIKQEGNEMVVEISKPDEFMITNDDQRYEDKLNNTNSEESEPEPILEVPASIRQEPPALVQVKPAAGPVTLAKTAPASITLTTVPGQTVEIKEENAQAATATVILRNMKKVEEIRRKPAQPVAVEKSVQEIKEKSKMESSSGGASDKSLRLLEKELQELQRTNTRNETSKMPAKQIESLRNRRPQMHTSTPKPRTNDEKKSQASAKPPPGDKKVLPERRGVKENKKPEESKEKVNNVSVKEDKDRRDERETKTASKEEVKDKGVVKNGANNKSTSEEGVRRSSRPSKVKDYAKMIRDNRSETGSEVEDGSDEEEYNNKDAEKEKSSEALNKSAGRLGTRRKASKPPAKPGPAPAAAPAPAPATPAAAPAKKRGRPRKEPQEVPSKVRKEESDEEESKNESKTDDTDAEDSKQDKKSADEQEKRRSTIETPTKLEALEKSPNLLVAPSGQTLKKVPVKALPPGVKPLPLPLNARPMGQGELCEMQIGKKVVKVQKIMMTKAEVEAMAKKGLVEMKDGTMVLKQGIKLPTSDPCAIKSTLVGEESPKKLEKAVPTRCELGDA